jgi:hypothetical protein
MTLLSVTVEIYIYITIFYMLQRRSFIKKKNNKSNI